MLDDFQTAMVVDAAVVSVCAAVLIARGDLRHSHPATLYLGFHLLTFTLRGVGILLGAQTYLSTTETELSKALFVADIFLLAATVGWLSVGRKVSELVTPSTVQAEFGTRLRRDYAWKISAVLIPISLVTLLQYSYIPGQEITQVEASGYALLPVTWAGTCLGLMAYFYGLRPGLIIMASTLFGFIALQGASRYLLVLPAILLAQIYLDRHGKSWPSPRIIALALLLFVAFYPMKEVATSLQQGGSFSEARQTVATNLGQSVVGQDDQQRLLDQLAAVIQLSDASGKLYLGEPYLNVLYLPIPRSSWPEKPSLNQHLRELSTTRPLAQNGGVATIPGDLYLNFGLTGMLLVTILLARLSGLAFNRAYSDGYGSPMHLVYLLFAAAAIQIFRDGMVSFLIFAILKNLPLWVFLLLCWRAKSMRRHPRNRPLGGAGNSC